MIQIIDLQHMGNSQTIAAFLVESTEGLIVMETGPYSTFPQLKKGIEDCGYKVSDIKHVFLTHIHFDHAGAAWAFAEQGAKIYVHPFGAPHLAEPERLVDSARKIYREMMDVLWGDIRPIAKDRLVTPQDQETYTIGNRTFKAWYTPGHAIHHIAWQMGEVMFTGDIAGVQIGKGPVVAPLPPPDIHLEQWQNSIALLRKIQPEKIYITHFGEKDHIFPQLDALERNIRLQADWVKAHLDNGDSIEQMTPVFTQNFMEELTSQGLSKEEANRYMDANPIWMSIAGLVRYWKKKMDGTLY